MPSPGSAQERCPRCRGGDWRGERNLRACDFPRAGLSFIYSLRWAVLPLQRAALPGWIDEATAWPALLPGGGPATVVFPAFPANGRWSREAKGHFESTAPACLGRPGLVPK